jgi:hypothetical protein
MEFPEETLTALSALDETTPTPLPQSLEDYLVHVAKTGFTVYPWIKIKPLFKIKLENVIAEFSTTSPPATIPIMPNVEQFKFDEMKVRIFEQLESYDGIPFTIQRLCELITEPTKNYKRLDKFLRGLERVMLVVSTIESKPVEPEAMQQGSQNGAESSSLRSHSPGTNTGYRRLGDSLESPAKRMRLNIEEDGGPCDSAHPQPLTPEDKLPTGNECTASDQAAPAAADPTAADPAAAASPAAAAASSSAVTAPEAAVSASSSAVEDSSADSTPQVSVEEDDSMEIDTECTSSQNRLETSPEYSEGEGISTSAESRSTLPPPEVETNSEAEPSMGGEGAEVDPAPSADTAPTGGESAPTSGETAPSSESAHAEEQQSVESSLVAHQARADEAVADPVGLADSSDEAEKSLPAQAEKEGAPDQSECAQHPAPTPGAEASAAVQAEGTAAVGAEATAAIGAEATAATAAVGTEAVGANATAAVDAEATAAVGAEATAAIGAEATAAVVAATAADIDEESGVVVATEAAAGAGAEAVAASESEAVQDQEAVVAVEDGGDAVSTDNSPDQSV